MDDQHVVSRRSTLKGLGAMGAVMVLGGPAATAAQAETDPAMHDQSKPAVNPVDLAVERFSKGHSWAQAVFSAVAEQNGLDYQTAVKVSAGFGGGMMLGSVCGAVTGAIMAIGLKRGGTGQQSGVQTGTIVRQLADRFKAQHRSINCPDLTGVDTGKVDLNKPVELQAFYKEAIAKGTFTKCTGYVRDATTIVTELLADAPKGVPGTGA